MTPERILEVAQSMSRPAVELSVEGTGPICAVWGGAPTVQLPGTDAKHLFSFDASACPGSELNGTIALFRDNSWRVALAWEPDRKFQADGGGEPLRGRPFRSLPPVDAVFASAEPDVQDWLRSLSWEPSWGYNGNFPDHSVVAGYEDAYFDNEPLYGSTAAAILGGWHHLWPDGDWDDLVSDELLAFTLRDAEPWYEIWLASSGLRVLERIT